MVLIREIMVGVLFSCSQPNDSCRVVGSRLSLNLVHPDDDR
jgi:hypothetical protein